MKITDIFIHRPVLATVVSLFILVLGLRSLDILPVQQYPFVQKAVVSVNTAYTGADAAVVAGFITAPLEQAIAQANGIDYLTSNSSQGYSSIQASLLLNYEPTKALNEIITQVNSVLNELPKAAQLPAITIAVGDTIDSMYIGFYSTALPSNQITDYLIRVVQPKLQAIQDVQNVEILGGREFALRAWLDPKKMAAYKVTATDIANALTANDYISAPGRTDGQMITVNLTSETDLHTVEEFRNLVLKSKNGALVKLKDVATVSLGAQYYDTAVRFDGKEAVYLGIKVAPSANILKVIDTVKEIFPDIEKQLPEGLKGKVVYDATKFVESSINEVQRTLFEATAIVVVVIFLFLGTFRSVAIPVIAIPLSLIGSFFIMLVLGYTINLLTLLALVLAIGLVVDDAIIVVENVYRHIEKGSSPLEAALIGARELANPIIAISIVLIAVYVPIGFMQGLTGSLFKEFAFTLAGAVGISAIIALTLSPVMCAKFLKTSHDSKFSLFIDQQFKKLEKKYHSLLCHSLDYLLVTGTFAVIVFVSLYFLYGTSKSELAPQEDQGLVLAMLTAAPNASLGQTELYSQQIQDIFAKHPQTDHTFQIDGSDSINTSITGMVLKPWDERRLTASDLQSTIQQEVSKIAGASIAVFQPSPLPGSDGGLPVEFVITTTDSYVRLNEVSQEFMKKAQETGIFMYVDTDLKIDAPLTTVIFDKDKAAQLGLTMQDLGSALSYALGGGYINYFNLDGRSYQVIPQVNRNERINSEQILNYYITTPKGQAVPLSTVASLKSSVAPRSINHFQQLNSATISGIPSSHVSLGEALDALKLIAQDTLPQGYSIDYAGQSRQYIQEGSGLVITFLFALIIIFLALSALFESFRDPLIVLISVPMSICGAMIFINLGIGGASLNIYTQVGLITLIGLISKHGILIVQFANDLQKEGKTKREAIEMASSIRLRPILMTTASMVLGVFPLIMASGAGAVSRFNIGLTIASGIAIGTFFTLFMVPAMYLLLATREKPTHPKEPKRSKKSGYSDEEVDIILYKDS